MEHLLKHAKTQIQRELEVVENAKLEYVYEDILDKIDVALGEIGSESDWSVPYEDENPFDGERYADFKDKAYDNKNTGNQTAGSDGLMPSMNQLTDDLDSARLQNLAGIGEESLDPRDMNEDEFQKLLARLRPDLVNWATGKEGFENRVDKEEVIEEIQDALHKAKADSDGTVDMLQTFHEQVSDNLFEFE